MLTYCFTLLHIGAAEVLTLIAAEPISYMQLNPKQVLEISMGLAATIASAHIYTHVLLTV